MLESRANPFPTSFPVSCTAEHNDLNPRVMTIGLAVGSDVDQLRPRAVVIEAAEQAIGKVLPVEEQFFERDRM